MMATPIAFVMLKEARAPDKEALLAALRRRHPGLRWERGPDARDAKPNTPVVIRAGDHLLAILLMPVPLPYDQGIWQRASWMWPDAFHAADQHRAYLVVATFDSTGGMAGADLSAVESSRLATALIGGVLETLPGGLGVVWRGKVAGSAEAWVEQSPRAFEPFPDHPYRLWMEIVPFLSGATIGAYTVGLSAFIGREIEFEVDGLDEHGVVVRVANASSYLIANGLDANAQSGTVYDDEDGSVGRVALLHRNSRFNIGPVVSFFSLQDRFGRFKTYEIIAASIARNHPLLVVLSKVGLFDPAAPDNQIKLRPDHYVSEARLESFDDCVSGQLSKILATDACAAADSKARLALASGDIQSARSHLLPWAEEVRSLQATVRLALTLCDLFMFLPAPPRRP